MKNYKFKILFCVLNWGLGHASRSLVLIHRYLEEGNQLTIASSGLSLIWLKNELGTRVNYFELPDYEIRYASKSNFFLQMLLQIPKIISKINQENKLLKQRFGNDQLDLIISDNRYGCFIRNVKSIFITHQLYIKSGNNFIDKLLHLINFNLIQNFNECWIPDLEGSKLSGELSEFNNRKNVPKLPLKYIGVLSRFNKLNPIPCQKYILVILSGPEPSRTILEKKLLKIISNQNQEAIIFIRGTNRQSTNLFAQHIEVHDLLDSNQLNNFIINSKIVICRSGYSSIMDLYHLNKKAILIPTPGQTEQEYLAEVAIRHDIFETILENELDEKLIESINSFRGKSI